MDRPLPSNPELERRYIEALLSRLNDAAIVSTAIADVPEDVFTDRKLHSVFVIVVDLFRAGRLNPVDLLQRCAAEVEDGYTLAGALLGAYNPASLDTLSAWLADLKKLAHSRRLIFTCEAARDSAWRGDDPASVEAGLAEERARNATTYSSYRPATMADALDAFEDHRQRIANPSGALRFGVGAIDARALWLPSYGLILGRTSHGKSGLAVSMALNMARAGRHVVYYSLEQPAAQIVTRFLCILSGRPPEDVLANPDPDAVAWLQSAPLTILDGRRTVERIAGETLRLRRRGKCDAVFVDQMSRIQHDQRRGETQEMSWSRSSGRFAELWQELGVPVVVLAQLNSKDGRDHPLPSAAQIKNAGSLLEDADWVFVLDRPEGEPERFAKLEAQRRKLENEGALSDADAADWRGRVAVTLAKDRLAVMGHGWTVKCRLDRVTGQIV